MGRRHNTRRSVVLRTIISASLLLKSLSSEDPHLESICALLRPVTQALRNRSVGAVFNFGVTGHLLYNFLEGVNSRRKCNY